MRVIISAGGTGGHLYPAIALADELKFLEPATEILIVTGTSPFEWELVNRAGYGIVRLETQGFRRKASADFLKAFYKAGKGFLKVRRLMKSFLPHVVVGMGGAVSGPVVMAARFEKIPTLIQEQNIIPGLTNRWLGRVADVIAVSFDDSKRYFPPKKRVEVFGCPIRREILNTSRKKALKAFGFDSQRKTLIVLGGSRGAQALNEVVISTYHSLRDFNNLQILHITGRRNYQWVARKLDSLKKAGDKLIYRYMPYLNEVGLAYAVADLALCRSGGSTLAELAAWGIPALLVPYPYAIRAHQQANAEFYQSRGAAEIIPDEYLEARILVDKIKRLLMNGKTLAEMKKRMKDLGRPSAGRNLAKVVFEIAREVSEEEEEWDINEPFLVDVDEEEDIE